MPVVRIPTPTLPNPNAFDTLNAAADQLLDSDKIGYAIAARHTTALPIDRNYSWAEKERLVADNGPALALVRKSFTQPYLNPPVRSVNTTLPYYAHFRTLARLLAIESRTRANRGDVAGAASAALDAMELGNEIPRGAGLLGGLVGIACQAIGRREFARIVDSLNADQARAVLSPLERLRANRTPLADTLQEEKWIVQASLLELMRQPGALSEYALSVGTPVPIPGHSPLLEQLFYLAYSKRRIMSDYTTYTDAEIATAKQPYSTSLPASLPFDPITDAMTWDFPNARLQFAKTEALTGLLELKLALRAYRLEHGAYPQSLSALSPSIVPRLSADPFAKAGTFGYRRAGSSYVLYSIGPDGKDDGGKPIDTGIASKTNPNERYMAKPGSTGDIVAGKNGW